MKKITKTIFIAMLVLFGLSNIANGQGLFKDLIPGSVYSRPQGFITINGTMYFYTWASGPYLYQLWKSDGTPENTTLLKDTLYNTSQNDAISLHNVNGTLYIVINKGTGTYLWKSDGTRTGTVLVKALTSADNWTPVGNKLFFREKSSLWVSDGTTIGTVEVTSSVSLASVTKPMIGYKGKVYFQGFSISSQYNYEPYSSDGTAVGTTLLKEINPGGDFKGSSPERWFIYKDELYFYADEGKKPAIWKTDGTTTTKISDGEFSVPILFKNLIYFKRGIGLWKSDGTTLGTVFVTDSANQIMGANADYLITGYMKSTPPYDFIYKRTDGTNVVPVSKNVGSSASFVVLNNKMYSGLGTGGLWVTDGTETGSSQLATNISSDLHAYNGNVFYNGWTTDKGYELWSLNSGGSSGINSLGKDLNVLIYPNPSTGIVNIRLNTEVKNAHIKITTLIGKIVYEEYISSTSPYIDLNDLSNGIYLFHVSVGYYNQTQKIIIQK